MPFIPSHRQKLIIHLIQLFLVHIAIGFSIPRLFMKNQPRTRANTIALGMGVKSIILIFYQLLTENLQRFSRWSSSKANMIINCLEVIFWAAVLFLILQANLSRCNDISCTLSWVVVGVSIVIVLIQIPCAYFSILEWKESRKVSEGQGYETRAEEMMQKEARQRVEREEGGDY